MTPKSMLYILIFVLGAGLFTGVAQAHKVNMFAYAEGNQVFVEGYFSDGKRAKNGEVLVYGPDGEVLVQGETDEEGAYTFDIPRLVDLRITLNAGMGHMTEYVIARNELSGVPEEVSSSEPANEQQVQVSGVDVAAMPQAVGTVSAGISRAELKKAVGEAIRPLMRSISELEERRNFSDIVGGLGFIVGIAGVFFYVKARSMLQQAGKDKDREA